MEAEGFLGRREKRSGEMQLGEKNKRSQIDISAKNGSATLGPPFRTPKNFATA